MSVCDVTVLDAQAGCWVLHSNCRAPGNGTCLSQTLPGPLKSLQCYNNTARCLCADACCVAPRRNNNGFIEPTEFRDMLGDLGPNGDAMKDFVFDRVNQLSGSDRKLPLSAFANALVLVRATLLGY